MMFKLHMHGLYGHGGKNYHLKPGNKYLKIWENSCIVTPPNLFILTLSLKSMFLVE